MYESFTRPALRHLIGSFYDRLRVDPDLGPIFIGRLGEGDWSEHFEKLTNFWSDVLLKTKTYNGRPMPVHMTIPGIEADHFPIWLKHFRATSDELFAPELADELMKRAEMIGRGLQMGLFYRPEIAVVQQRPIPN